MAVQLVCGDPKNPITTTSNNMALTGGITAITAAVGTASDCTTAAGPLSRVACLFKQEVGVVMSTVYCKFQAELIGPLKAALILAVTVYGIMMISGMVQNTWKESAIFLFKMALIWGFATSSTFGIGYAYTFFMEGAEEGANIVVSAVSGISSYSGSGATLSTPDQLIAGTMQNIMETSSALYSGGSGGSAAGPFPSNVTPYCEGMIVGAMVFLCIFVPLVPVTVIGLGLTYLELYIRVLLGYFAALTLICFLFVFSPLFFGFALFRATKPLFDNWLNYLITLALELIITFAFFALISYVIAPLATFAPEILGLVREYDDSWSKDKVVMPMNACSFCEYNINPPSVSVSSGSNPPAKTKASALLPSIACTGTTYSAPTSGSNPSTQFFKSVIPTSGSGGGSYTGDNQNVWPLWSVLNSKSANNNTPLLQFLIENFVALWLIISVMIEMFKRSEELAKAITSAPSAIGITGDGLQGATQSDRSLHYPGVGAISKIPDKAEGLIQRNLPWNANVNKSPPPRK